MKIRSSGIRFGLLCFISTALFLSGTSTAIKGTVRDELMGKMSSDLGIMQGDVGTVVIFAQSDCGSCSQQLAYLSSLSKKYSNLEYLIVTERNDEAMKEYLGSFTLSQRVIVDSSGSIIENVNIKSLPAIGFFKKTGELEAFYEGILTRDELAASIESLSKGTNMPVFRVLGDVGGNIELKDLKFEMTDNNLLIFFTSTCQYCLMELPFLVEYARNHPKVNVSVVSLDGIENVERVFLNANAPKNITFVEDALDGVSLYRKYNIQGTPTNIMMDKSGKITWKSVGFNEISLNPFKDGAIPLKGDNK